MSQPKKPDIANFRADYAKLADFCEVCERDMKRFYLLAFLLTTNHKEAEQCFASTVEKGCEENSVFKGWIESWIKRGLITKAIHIVFSGSARANEQRNLWCEGVRESQVSSLVNAVTSLDDLERFVFVMSILEGYSSRECSLLLKCTTGNIVQLRVRASCKLADFDPFFTGDLAVPAGRRESA